MKTKKHIFVAAVLAVTATAGTAAAGGSHVGASAGCDRLPRSDAAVQAFYVPGNVYAAKKLQKRVFLARAIQPMRTIGAKLYMHAQPGVTREYLQRALSCQVASAPGAQPNDPLHPSEGRVSKLAVKSAGGSYAIAIKGDSPAAGREIWNRARAFAGGDVTVEQVATGLRPSTL